MENEEFEEVPPRKANTLEDKKRQAQRDLESLRSIINSDALAKQEKKHKECAQKYVSDVISEALDERQQKDNSVARILAPLVEQSIESSVSHHRQKFVDYLYPLVGDLVKKFATVFLRDFIEKTNELIEKSLSFKSLTWRYKAKRAGLTYSRYVASQVYVYQVQQVLLIHKNTGILLNSSSLNPENDENSDLISAMLSAISDFVNDSFSQHKQLGAGQSTTDSNNSNKIYSLDEIKVDDFTLYIKQGPQAFIVGAVLGNISPEAKDKLQRTLEEIHSRYMHALQTFKGDVSVFESTSSALDACLISEEKANHVDNKKSKKPWLATLLFLGVFVTIAYYGIISWQTNALLTRIKALPQDQGIVINRSDIVGVKNIQIMVLRDPNAISVDEWLLPAKLDSRKNWLFIDEVPFMSLSQAVVKRRVQTIIDEFALANTEPSTKITYAQNSNLISGQLTSAQLRFLKTKLTEVDGIELLSPTINITEQESESLALSERFINQRALELLSADINQQQIEFSSGSAAISDADLMHLTVVVKKYEELKTFAQDLELVPSLLILGASDNVGSEKVNQILSLQRAESTAKALVSLGLKRNEIMTSGIGIVEGAPPNTNIRKAIIYVILANKQPSK